MLLLLIFHIENWLFKLGNWVDSSCFLGVHFCIASFSLWLILDLVLYELGCWLDDLSFDSLLILETRGEARLWESVTLARLLTAIRVISHAFQLYVSFGHFSLFRVRRTVPISICSRSSWTRSLIDVNWSSWNHIWIILFYNFNYII